MRRQQGFASGGDNTEVWAGPIGGLKQVTHLNDGAKIAGGKTESLEWTNGEFHVQDSVSNKGIRPSSKRYCIRYWWELPS